jgi:hypothetical protein
LPTGKNAKKGKSFTGTATEFETVSKFLRYANGRAWYHGMDVRKQVTAESKSPSLALCIVALKAHESDNIEKE